MEIQQIEYCSIAIEYQGFAFRNLSNIVAINWTGFSMQGFNVQNQ